MPICKISTKPNKPSNRRLFYKFIVKHEVCTSKHFLSLHFVPCVQECYFGQKHYNITEIEHCFDCDLFFALFIKKFHSSAHAYLLCKCHVEISGCECKKVLSASIFNSSKTFFSFIPQIIYHSFIIVILTHDLVTSLKEGSLITLVWKKNNYIAK